MDEGRIAWCREHRDEVLAALDAIPFDEVVYAIDGEFVIEQAEEENLDLDAGDPDRVPVPTPEEAEDIARAVAYHANEVLCSNGWSDEYSALIEGPIRDRLRELGRSRGQGRTVPSQTPARQIRPTERRT